MSISSSRTPEEALLECDRLITYYQSVMNASIVSDLNPTAARDLLYSAIAVKRDIQLRIRNNSN